ncbi:MAG TPA: TIGR03842 family LLM class F420-dependent oxidoreductase [Euzebya sp.]|nr:TIGR03842 family LLM class F420-dependent oxidoreductase [Euzebya sp.]
MDFGIVLQTDPPAWRSVELARLAETYGFSHAWSFDSHVLWQEPYPIYTAILAATKRMVVGPMVTNPGTRDWTVTASLYATLNDMFGNRTICGIGRGDSAMRVIGKQPCTLAQLGEAIDTIRSLARGEEVDYGGTPLRFPWVTPWDPTTGTGSRTDVLMAAYGPKALKLAGERADGFILQLADTQIAEWTIAAVKKAASDAGRDPESLQIVVAAPAYVGGDGQGADLSYQRDQVRWFGGMVGNHVADLVERYGADTDLIPDALRDYIKDRKGYDYAEHGKATSTHVDFVGDDIIDRFCILGTVDQHVARLEELRALGVTQFAIYLQHDGKDETLQAYGQKVIPTMRAAATA